MIITLYRSNLDQPLDKCLILKDIIDNGDALKEKSQTIPATIYKENAKSMLKRNKLGLLVKIGSCESRPYDKSVPCHHAANTTDLNGHESLKRVYADTGKSPTLNTCTGGNREVKVIIND